MNIKIESIFGLDSKTERSFLSEKELQISFSYKHLIYYNILRDILPKSFRKILQEKSQKNIVYKDDFIYREYVNYLNEELKKENIVFTEKYKNIFGQNNSCGIIITHDVEEQDGFDYIPRLIEIDEKYGFKSSFNIVPYKYRIDKGIVDLIKENGCEVGIHGYNHDGKLYYSEKIFNERVPYINEAIKTYDAVGFRSPMVHRNIEWLQKLEIQYDASCFDYDPFQPFPGGVGSIWPFIAGKFVELPYTLPQDHTMFYVLKVKDISIWKNKVDWIVNNNGMALLLTHPDYLMERQNMKLYEEFLDYLNSIQNSWRCLPREMAEHWRAIQNLL